MHNPALEYFLETLTASLNEQGFSTDESEVYFCARLALLLFQNASTPKTMLSLQIYSDLTNKSLGYRRKLQALLVANKLRFKHTALSESAKKQVEDVLRRRKAQSPTQVAAQAENVKNMLSQTSV